MKNKDDRPFLDNSYYKCLAVIRTGKYQLHLQRIRETLEKIKLPLPINGFSTSKDYLQWSNKLIKKEIIPDEFIKEILIAYGLNPKDEEILLKRLKFIVFFNIKEINAVPLVTRSVYIPDSGNDIVVELHISKDARKQDVDFNDLWKVIEMHQMLLKEKKGRNTYWVNFDQDLEVYALFQKVENDIRKGIFKDKEKHSKSPYHHIPYYDEFEQIAFRYKGKKIESIDKLEDNLPTIIGRCKKRFGKLILY